MRTVTFIRHAQSVANAGGITLPHRAIPLSELGLRQAQDLALTMSVKPALVLASNFVRTQQTAVPFCQRHGVGLKIDPNLDEFSMIDSNLIVGLNGAQRKPFSKAYWAELDVNQRLGIDADTFLEFNDRVGRFIATMGSLPDSTVVFGHGIWIALFLWKRQGNNVKDGQSMGEFRRFQLNLAMPNCGIFVVPNETPNIDQIGF